MWLVGDFGSGWVCAGWIGWVGYTKSPTRAWVFDQRGECWLDVVPDEMWERRGGEVFCIGLVWLDVVVEARWAIEVHDAVEVGVEGAGVGVEGVAHGVGAIDGALGEVVHRGGVARACGKGEGACCEEEGCECFGSVGELDGHDWGRPLCIGLKSLVCDGMTIARFVVCDPLYGRIEVGVSWSFREVGLGGLEGVVIHWLCSIVVELSEPVGG